MTSSAGRTRASRRVGYVPAGPADAPSAGSVRRQRPLPARLLRWRCDAAALPFASTDDVPPLAFRAAQRRAWDALEFAIRCDSPDQNAFVRGLLDTERELLVRDALAELRPPLEAAKDVAYVRNDREPHRPRVLLLAAGRARRFARSVQSFAEFVRRTPELRRGTGDAAAEKRRAREILDARARSLAQRFPGEGVGQFLAAAVDEILDSRFGRGRGAPPDPAALCRVHVVKCHDDGDVTRPVVFEDDPTPARLLGSLSQDHSGPAEEHLRIRAGAFVQADGGYLVLDAARVHAAPGAWQAIAGMLRTGLVHVQVPDRSGATLLPDPIPVRVRILLVGDRDDHRALDERSPWFSRHFRVLADMDADIARDESGFRVYAGWLARLARREDLPRFDRSGIAALVEHGARIVGSGARLTARFGRISDVAREAAFLAASKPSRAVAASHVRRAVLRTKERASLDARRFLGWVAERSVLIDVHGSVVGQVNGLSVIHAGPVTYGFPARITASVGAGSEGILDIESRADLSGSIHTKGFQILQGLLRRLLETDHPLAFTASLASEQTYGRVDGDSSSAAQLCCLLSALARVPIRQGLAVTGSIDQLGRVQSVAAVDQKIEGFFDVCRLLGLDGTQGVVIPRSNVADLMLREDVVRACRRREFHVYDVETIYELLSLLTGLPATVPGPQGTYAQGSLLAQAVAGSRELWESTLRTPARRADGPARSG